MKTFFYTAVSPNCSGGCHYTTCPRRYYSMLQSRDDVGELHLLDESIFYKPHLKQPTPQHGDIMILFAQGGMELMTLNECCEKLEGMNKILVVGDTTGIDGSMYHRLSPRYITQAGRAIEELGLVIENLKIHTNCIS